MASNNKYTEILNSIEGDLTEITSDSTDDELAADASAAVIRFFKVLASKLREQENKPKDYNIVAYHMFDFHGTLDEMQIDAMKKIGPKVYKVFTEYRDRLIELEYNSEKKIGIQVSLNANLLKIKQQEFRDISDIIGIKDESRKVSKINELFELDATQVLVKNRKNKNIENWVPKFAVKRVVPNAKYCMVKGGECYFVTKDDYKKIMRESTRPYTDSFLSEKYGILGKLKKQIEKLEKKVAEEDKLMEENPWIIKYMNEHPGKSVDEYLDVIRKKIKEDAYKKINDANNLLKVKSSEVRDRQRRIAIQQNRSHYRPIDFSTQVKNSTKVKIDKIIENQIKSIKKTLQDIINKQTKIAFVGYQQKIYDSEHIHKPGDNTIFDKYVVSGKRIVRQTMSVPKKKVEEWYKETLGMDIVLTPEWDPEEYEIVGILKPSYVKNTKSKWKEKTKKGNINHEVDAGSLLAATYFYTLVSNTPVDETYNIGDYGSINGDYSDYGSGEKINYWDRARIAIKRNPYNHSKNSENKTLAEIVEELKNQKPRIKKTYYRNKVHIPDNESVRGDWVLHFRGKTFKAYNSEPAKNSKSVSNPIYFTPEDFMNPVTDSALQDLDSVFNDKGKIKNTNFKPYIWNIAEVIAKNTDSNSDDTSIIVENINPRWQILEYGGYKSAKSGPWMGSGKYGRPHGVTSEGFSYQAPMGFKRIIDAQYNAIMTKSALYNKSKGRGDIGSASAYTRGNRSLDWNFDITHIDEPKFLAFMDKIVDQDNTLTLENIHTIDGTKVWKWEKVK